MSTISRIEELAKQGKSMRAIAAELGISGSAVNRHVQRLRKAGRLPPGPKPRSVEEVAEIRRLYQSKEVLTADIAKIYHIGLDRIPKICRSD